MASPITFRQLFQTVRIFGQYGLIPIWVATLAVRQRSRCVHVRSRSELLEEFGLPRNGKPRGLAVILLWLVYGAITFHRTNVRRLSGRRRETLVAGGCG